MGFSVALSLWPVLVVAAGEVSLGRVWEGATAPLPIEHDVSEANSFWGGRWPVARPIGQKLTTQPRVFKYTGVYRIEEKVL